MKDLAYYNGKITPISEMTIPANDRAYYFGDGIYDVAMVLGGKCFALEDHLDRFMTNAGKLRLNLNLTKDQLRALCLDLVSRLDKDVTEAVLYFQASRGTAPRNHPFPENATANLFFTLKEGEFKKMGREVSAISVEDIRFYMCNIKTLNLLPNVIAAQKATELGAYEAILHRSERVTEGSHSGVSIIKDGVFQTPPLDELILPSVTRKHYLELCRMIGVPVLEAPFTMKEMLEADEIIIMSSTAVMNRCTKIDGKKVGGKDPETLARIAKAYQEKIDAEVR